MSNEGSCWPKITDMARYEYNDGKSRKFWEIVVKGASFTTTYGRIGTDGQSKTKEFADKAKAKAEAEKITAQKVKKGYAPTKGAAKKPAAKKPAAKKPAAKKPAAKKPAAKKPAAKKPSAKKPSNLGGIRLEFSDGKSNKFWEISLDGQSFTVVYGRLGTEGTSSTKDFATEAAALKKRDALIKDKIGKGYQPVAGDVPKSLVTVSAQNPKLESALAKDPTDLNAASVYADWLQGKGDPRGELAAIQIAKADASGAAKTKLAKAEAKLLAEYGDVFVPGLVADVQARHIKREPKKSNKWGHKSWLKDTLSLGWSAGFVASLRLAIDYDEDAKLVEVLETFLAHPSSRLLQDLEVGSLNIADTYNYSPILSVLAKAKLPALRRLFIAEFHSEQCELSWSSLGGFSSVWKAAPNLESVVVRGGSFELGPIKLAKAKSFEVQTGGLSGKNFKAIALAKWPALERLAIWFGTENYGGTANAKMVKPFLDSANIAKVTDLGLMNCDFIDDLCALLPKSKIAKRLERLDLSMGTMSDAGAEALAAGAKAFPKLRELNIERNFVSAAGLAALKGFTKTVLTKGQETPDDWGDGELHRYVSVGE